MKPGLYKELFRCQKPFGALYISFNNETSVLCNAVPGSQSAASVAVETGRAGEFRACVCACVSPVTQDAVLRRLIRPFLWFPRVRGGNGVD